jgi:hypothetical protein
MPASPPRKGCRGCCDGAKANAEGVDHPFGVGQPDLCGLIELGKDHFSALVGYQPLDDWLGKGSELEYLATLAAIVTHGAGKI